MSHIQAIATAEEMRQIIRQKSKLKGRQPEASALAEVLQLIGAKPANGYRRDLLIEYLHLLNDKYRALFDRHLVALAKLIHVPMAEVFEVASFYHHFDLLTDGEEAPALTVRVCNGLSCSLRSSNGTRSTQSTQSTPSLLTQLQQCLDADIKVIPAPCVGRCEQAPVAVVGQLPVPNATTKKVNDIVVLALKNGALASGDSPYINYAQYCTHGGYALAAKLSRYPDSSKADSAKELHESIINILEDSGLRGLGGAGFPAGRKWRIVKEQASPRLMAINIDEGEPGTFKDRTYLERDPHRFIEGMLVAAQVVGIDACYIYLRDEYHDCRAILQRELDVLRAANPFKLPLIELRRGAGAYICGEESAMIESIEGKRGAPRLRPPYVAQVGLFNRPTLAHNFETLFWVRELLEKGAHWFASQGRNGRKGLRSFSVSGRIKSPGVKLAPAGICVSELIAEYCGGMQQGHELYAYLPGGASGGILPASLGHLPLDFDTLQPYGCFIGSAAIIVLSQHDKARDAALNMMEFFEHESCGQCTPCRVGTAKAAQLMTEKTWDKGTLDDLSQVMLDASICGLGQAAPNPMVSVLRYFTHEVSGAE